MLLRIRVRKRQTEQHFFPPIIIRNLTREAVCDVCSILKKTMKGKAEEVEKNEISILVNQTVKRWR